MGLMKQRMFYLAEILRLLMQVILLIPMIILLGQLIALGILFSMFTGMR